MIQVENLTKIYAMGDTVVRALDGISFEAEKGGFGTHLPCT